MSTSTELANAILHAQQIGAHHLVPILRAARAGRLNFLLVTRGSDVSMRPLKTSGKPGLVLIGDDDDAATGPAGWPHSLRLIRWCEAVMVHSTGAEVRHYEAAVDGALLHRRMLMIETDSGHEQAWLDVISRLRPRLPRMIVRVRPGAPAHPIQSIPAGVTRQ